MFHLPQEILVVLCAFAPPPFLKAGLETGNYTDNRIHY